MKDIVIQQYLLAGYLCMKQNAMALRDGGEVHPAFRSNWGTCANIAMYGRHIAVGYEITLEDEHAGVLHEYVQTHLSYAITQTMWPFGAAIYAKDKAWDNPQRLAFVDWAIGKIEQRIAELENTNGDNQSN